MRQLGALEAVVMDRMWSREGAAAVREVLEDLQRDRTLAYTTVMTVMDNLHRKGMLVREKEGRAYKYRAVHTREQYTAAIMGQTLAASSNPSATLLHFLKEIPSADIALLREALVEHIQNSDTSAS